MSSDNKFSSRISKEAIEEAMRLAAQDVVRRHQFHNVPLVEWRDGKVVRTPAHSIRLEERR